MGELGESEDSLIDMEWSPVALRSRMGRWGKALWIFIVEESVEIFKPSLFYGLC